MFTKNQPKIKKIEIRNERILEVIYKIFLKLNNFENF